MSNKGVSRVGSQELRRPLLRATGALASVGLFSIFVNLLMLVGPLFMLQVYDRALGRNFAGSTRVAKTGGFLR